MARTPEPDVNITEAIQPVAAEHDTYVRPETPAPSPLHAVADALAPLSADLFGLAAQQQTQANDDEKKQADTDFWTKNQAGAAQAVADGTVPAQHSKIYMDRYAQLSGQNDGLKLAQQIGPAYEQVPKNTDDPAAFDKWFFNWASTQANPGMKNNPNYGAGYAHVVQQLHAQYAAKFVNDRSDAVKADATQQFTGNLGSTIDINAPGDSTQPVDAAKLGDTVQTIRQLGVSMGMNPPDVDKLVVDTIKTKAIEHKNPQILDALDHIPVNPKDPKSVTLGATEYGNAAKINTQKTIQTTLLQDRERQYTADQRADKKAADGAIADVQNAWAKDPSYSPTPDQIATIQKTRPEFLGTVAAQRENILKGNTAPEDPNQVSQVMSDIFTSPDPRGVLDTAIRQHTATNPETIAKLTQYANTVETYYHSGGAFKITNNQQWKDGEAQIKMNGKEPKLGTTISGEVGLSPGGRQALNDYHMAGLKWAAENPTAGPLEQQKFLNDLQESILSRFKPPDDPLTEPSTYTAPAAAPASPPTAVPGKQAPAAPAQGQPPAGSTGALPPGMSTGQAETIQQENVQRSKDDAGLGKQGSIEAPVQTASAAQPVSFDLGNGQRVELHGVNPEIAQHFQQLAQRYLGVSQAQASTGPTPAAIEEEQSFRQQHPEQIGGQMVDNSRVQRINALPVHSTIEQVAKETGFDPDKLKAIVSIESGGRAGVSTGSYHGLLQLSQAEFQKYGKGGNIMDPASNLRAGVASLQAKEAGFKREFGREPSATELYLMHQQGEAGLRAHEKNLDGLAWKSMASTGEGRQKGERWAKLAVWGNVPTDMRKLVGSVDQITSRQFIAVWMHKLEGTPYQTALASMGHGRTQVASND
jgi:hypothetical protein